MLEKSKRAYEFFASSEVEQKRQLAKPTLQNLRVGGKGLRYKAIKPFDAILNFADDKLWLQTVESIRELPEEQFAGIPLIK